MPWNSFLLVVTLEAIVYRRASNVLVPYMEKLPERSVTRPQLNGKGESVLGGRSFGKK